MFSVRVLHFFNSIVSKEVNPGVRICVELLDLCGEVEVALGAEEEPVADAPGRSTRSDELVKRRMRGTSREPKAPGSAFGVEPQDDGDSFQQRRLAGPVLADEE